MSRDSRPKDASHLDGDHPVLKAVVAATEPPKLRGLPWARPLLDRRCQAVREPRGDSAYSGRCELVRGHGPDVDHALERGFDIPRWSTDWTA